MLPTLATDFRETGRFFSLSGFPVSRCLVLARLCFTMYIPNATNVNSSTPIPATKYNISFVPNVSIVLFFSVIGCVDIEVVVFPTESVFVSNVSFVSVVVCAFSFATYDSVSFVNGLFVFALGCSGSGVNKADVNVWISVLVDFLVIGNDIVVVFDDVVLVVVACSVVVILLVVVVVGCVVILSEMYTLQDSLNPLEL